MANRLAQATSPYLRQHRDNPVDWWEWSPAAFAEAKRRDVPILLSIGYAACHWCHVMAHESFQDPVVAQAVNAGFVAIKVDREERPDIDAAYMSAATALTGSGGWPMTCVLTPDGEPFFAGTYFPKAQFLHLLSGLDQVWRQDRAKAMESGKEIATRLRELTATTLGTPLDAQALPSAVTALRHTYDEVRGGFGGAPKFPPSMVLEFLLREHARTGSADALAMVQGTCEAMARSGLYDQLAGGFARYAVDADWVVPHFEKMLYDNAQLLSVYTHLWQTTGSPLARRVALETGEFISRDLLTEEGGFASSLDADTVIEGQSIEGWTYTWTPAELRSVLGDDDGSAAAELLAVTEAGTFEHGRSTLQQRHDPSDEDWWSRAKAALLKARAQRPQPARDDKVVTSWNALAITALAEAGAILHRPDFTTAATRCARLILDEHLVEGCLRRSSLAGQVGKALGLLDDYGNLCQSLLILAQFTGDAQWLTPASALLADAEQRFFDPTNDTWRDTPSDGEALYLQPQTDTDNAEPSGAAAIAGALLTHHALTGRARDRDLAQHALRRLSPVSLRDPRFAGQALAVAVAMAAGPVQIAVVGSGDDAEALRDRAIASTSPGRIIACGDPEAPGWELLAQRPLVSGRAAAYVCRGMVCDRPVTSPADLETSLAALRSLTR